MPITIAYLDDEEMLGELFLEFFEDEDDYSVAVFSDHEPFIAHCAEAKPNLVFIDFHLRGTRGDVVAEALDPNLPKILMTGELAVEVGDTFTTVLSKPCRFDDILDAIEQHATP